MEIVSVPHYSMEVSGENALNEKPFSFTKCRKGKKSIGNCRETEEIKSTLQRLFLIAFANDVSKERRKGYIKAIV